MKLLTWNVNSIRAREARLLGVLERHKPDVACLQELKATEEQFPLDAVRAAGYHAAIHGQKTWNGVAILSREAPEDVRRGLGDGAADPQARLVSARVAGARVICAYVPNGEEVGSEKWAYKLEWLARLRRMLDKDCKPGEPLLLAGDLNVAPDDKDVAKPQDWAGTVLCHADARAALARVAAWGLLDVVRKHHPEGGLYTWWDYRMLAFPKGNGLRIDHVLATKPLADRSRAASMDRDERKGEKPSDHAPVVVEFG